MDNNESTEHFSEETSEETTTKEEIVEESVSWELIWSDEFDGAVLDSKKWSYELGNSYNGWGNHELQYYKKENVYVEDGKLVIEAKREAEGECEYTSGRIRTVTDDGDVLFSTKYGRIEARISMPAEVGMWPAFWMMPVDNKYGTWPCSGEIDIVEARGRIADEINGTIHYGEKAPNNKKNGEDYFLKDSSIEEFHIYAIEWTPDEIKWFVDGEQYYASSSWYAVDKDNNVVDYPAPFNESFYLLLNMAVGGDYDNGVTPEDTFVSEKMYVDYVRVYRDKNGYGEVNEEKKDNGKDKESFELYGVTDDFVTDKAFELINTEPYIDEVQYEMSKWYFVAKMYFEGSAKGSIKEIDGKPFFFCDVKKAAEKRYSIQLIHRVPLIKGYTYVVEFEAKAKKKRAISLQPMGHKDGEAISYSERIKIELNKELSKYRYSFTVQDDTDTEGFIEFNLGAESADVYIGDVSIRIID